jgi:hypothetical protein
MLGAPLLARNSLMLHLILTVVVAVFIVVVLEEIFSAFIHAIYFLIYEFPFIRVPRGLVIYWAFLLLILLIWLQLATNMAAARCP